MIGQRIRQLRYAKGLTLESLAAELGGIVTKQSLSKYELEKAKPSALVLNKIANIFGVKSSYIWGESNINIKFVAYRKHKSLELREQEKVESFVITTLEKYTRLQNIINIASNPNITLNDYRITSESEVESVAEKIRKKWELGSDPISSVTGILEDNYIHVLSIQANDKFDGISAYALDKENNLKGAMVVSRSNIPGERQRLTLLHELGHLIFDMSDNIDPEKSAYRFGAAFLFPENIVYKDVGVKRETITFNELFILKKRYGLSVQALLYRLKDLNIISNNYFDFLYKEVIKRGWKSKEPEESEVEESLWLKQNVLKALAENFITIGDAKTMLGNNINQEESLAQKERKAFLKLPLAERRRILANQSNKIYSFYEEHINITDFDGGDIVEY